MRCSACGADNPAGAKFCNTCGAAQALTCPQCRHHNPSASRFCNECGGPLGAPQQVVPDQESSSTSPESYTPKHLAEKILAARGALEGERKQVTVLFADVAGSTELIRELDSEEAQALLDGAVRAMMDAVHRYEGTVNHILGDGIMALFGAPLAHEDHAVRACYAALGMQEAIRRYADETRRRYGIAIEVRVGVNSGEVVVRSIANDLRMDYSAMGQTVHLASRMEQLAKPGAIALTPATLALAEGMVEVRPLGPIPVKGVAEPVEVFELMGAGAARSRLQVAAARGLTRFVGRRAEMEAIDLALDRAGGGHGQVVALVGEPGVGKSRVVWEVTHSGRARGWKILTAGARSYGKATPYLPVVDLVKSYCRIDDRDDPRTVTEKVAERLLSLDEDLRPALPALLALLDMPVVDDAAWQALDPPQRRRRTLDALSRLLLRESLVQPLLLAFEDLHWIDSETQALLDRLVESLPAARILLLMNYRPEYRHEWGSRTYYAQFRIDPLPPEDADDLLASLLGGDPSVAALKPLLAARTERNPFFLEESVRALVETGALVGERGSYRLTGRLEDVRVPATVRAVLAARIDRLAPEDKHALQVAAVIGKDVPSALLRAVADLPEQDLQHGLARLRAAEFLYPATVFPEPEYTFKHALTHEVAYGSLLQGRRRALHRRIAGVIEGLSPERLMEQVELLAHHASRGEAWDKAVRYHRQAGHKALGRSANRAAAASFEQALAALEHLPDDRDAAEQAIDLRFDLRTAYVPLGELGRIGDHLRAAEALAGDIGDRRRLGWTAAYLSAHAFMTGDNDRAVESGRRALALADDLADTALQAASAVYLGQAHFARGEYPEAARILARNPERLRGELARERFGQPFLPAVHARTWLAWCLAERGQFDEALALAEEGLRIAEAVGHSYSLVSACFGMGIARLRRGETAEAMPVLERGLAYCRERDVPLHLPWFASTLGLAYGRLGRHAEALPLADEAVERATAMGYTVGHSLWVVHRGEAYLLAGRLQDARRCAEDASALAIGRKERGVAAHAIHLLGELAGRAEPAEVAQAEGRYRESLTLAEELGMRPLQAHAHLGLGKLYRKTGRTEEARAELSAAAELYRSMEMTFWLPRAEAELAQATSSTPTPTRSAG